MKPVLAALAILPAALAGGCVAPVGPVEVTRFHLPGAALARGTIAVEPGSGMDGASLEYRSYAAAVARELVRVGYTEQVAGRSPQVAHVRVERVAIAPSRGRSPVTVGVGGGTGGYHSGVGVGVGIDLSGPPPEEIVTTLSVSIRERAGNRVVWEGRASFTARADAPLARTQLGAAKLAEALFQGFPGRSGETILVQ